MGGKGGRQGHRVSGSEKGLSLSVFPGLLADKNKQSGSHPNDRTGGGKSTDRGWVSDWCVARGDIGSSARGPCYRGSGSGGISTHTAKYRRNHLKTSGEKKNHTHTRFELLINHSVVFPKKK